MPQSMKARVFTREFKVEAVRRMLAGCNVSALGRELGVLRKDLYVWRERFRTGGEAGFMARGRPRKVMRLERVADPPPGSGAVKELAAARRRVVELERKIGQQQIDLDFFQQALRRVRELPSADSAPGAAASTRSSDR